MKTWMKVVGLGVAGFVILLIGVAIGSSGEPTYAPDDPNTVAVTPQWIEGLTPDQLAMLEQAISDNTAIEPTTAAETTPSQEPTAAAPVAADASWKMVARMTTSSSNKNGNVFTVRGAKQKLVIKYTNSDGYGAGASLYVFAKGDNSQDGYTEMVESGDKSGSESSILYLDPGQYYLKLGVFGGVATGQLFDYR